MSKCVMKNNRAFLAFQALLSPSGCSFFFYSFPPVLWLLLVQFTHVENMGKKITSTCSQNANYSLSVTAS